MTSDRRWVEQAAIARREYWREQAKQAASRGDTVEAFNASRIVAEYDGLIAHVHGTEVEQSGGRSSPVKVGRQR